MDKLENLKKLQATLATLVNDAKDIEKHVSDRSAEIEKLKSEITRLSNENIELKGMNGYNALMQKRIQQEMAELQAQIEAEKTASEKISTEQVDDKNDKNNQS